ncbi:thioredoxin reductase [Kipferlia bialata]|uniref:Thioredoxin reductase n=1 Tax=Kipferlia bialata TaxID=797122 RepID=A0A9K3D0I1_9EUKA|nr:thioredoxin reductase [Kipferlia bialata]|eukprot:g8321.t1
MTHSKCCIIGGGPAGLTAALYAARAGLEPVVFVGIQTSSQLSTTTLVENFPGFPEGVMGPELVDMIMKQATTHGAQVEWADVAAVDLTQKPFKITYGFDNSEMTAETVILATGSVAKRLHPPGADEYWQKGISCCAVCDSFIAKDNVVYVVGGGDAAIEDATYLLRHAKEVHLVHRRDQLRGSAAMQERVLKNENVHIHWDTTIAEVLGDGEQVTHLRLQNVKTGDSEKVECGALFWAVGHNPNTAFVKGQVDLDAQGYIVRVEPPYMKTSVPGVFVAGDAADHVYRQAIVAAGSGSKAALDAERYITEQESLKL